ncbi:MAG: hypothetical protein OEZ41_09720 [Nitrospirota bacterium]|nr:hypothetical protein [Nitrospirota bacterium]MDH5700224.1 hypothetical protein [Nitrospirota bacterium]
MQRLDLSHSELPDLQFVLMVLALCTSDLQTMNAPRPVREAVFNRCWALMHESPPPVNRQERVLDLKHSDEITLEALVHVIRQTFEDHGIVELTWEHPPSEPTRESTPEAGPLVERLQQWEPPPDELNPPSSSSTNPTH